MPQPLVTLGLPVRNGADSIGGVARSVLAQDYENIEFLISDNASTDGTEAVCRELARTDSRIRYHRHSTNIGLINNFEWLKHNCRGSYLRWIGDSDEISPEYVTRCIRVFDQDPDIVLVTTQLEYLTDTGELQTMQYESQAMHSADPVVRLDEMLLLLRRSHLLIDPLYAMTKVAAVAPLRHDQILRGDEVYATKLALAGPWGHVPEVLGRRPWDDPSATQLVRLLGVPRWHVRVRGLIEARKMREAVDAAGLRGSQKRRATVAIAKFYGGRHWAILKRRGRRLRAELRRTKS